MVVQHVLTAHSVKYKKEVINNIDAFPFRIESISLGPFGKVMHASKYIGIIEPVHLQISLTYLKVNVWVELAGCFVGKHEIFIRYDTESNIMSNIYYYTASAFST